MNIWQANSAFTLKPEQIAFFHEQGFVAMEAITTQDEVAQVREIYDRLFSERVGRDEGNQFDLGSSDEDDKEAVLPQILAPEKYAPELMQTHYVTNATAVAKQLLGPEARFAFAHMIYKPPRIGAATPWHQDPAYGGGELIARSVSIWMPLQQASIENGCMQYAPKSHIGNHVHPHHPINHDPRVHGLEVDNPDVWARQAVACPIPAGGATMHASYTMHYAGPNRSDVPRRAWILNFRIDPLKRDKPVATPWLQSRQTPRSKRAEQAAKSAGSGQ